MGSKFRVDRKVDARDLVCPGALMETIRTLKTMKKGEVLEVLASDDSSARDIPFWVKRDGNEILLMEKIDEYWRILIRKS